MSTESKNEKDYITPEELAATSQPKAPEKPISIEEPLTPVEKALDEAKAAPPEAIPPITPGETPKVSE